MPPEGSGGSVSNRRAVGGALLGAAGLAAVALAAIVVDRDRELVRDTPPTSAAIAQLGWRVMPGDRETLRIDYEVVLGHALRVAVPASSVPEIQGLLDYAESLARSTREGKRIPRATFVNRAVVGAEYGRPGRLHVGRSVAVDGQDEMRPALAAEVEGLDGRVRALVEAVDRAAVVAAEADLAKRQRMVP